MRISDFINTNMEQIIKEWELFARTLPAAYDMNSVALKDHVKQILKFIMRDVETPQTALSQSNKSKGRGPEEGGGNDSAAQIHADLRSESGFDMPQLAAEYRALRASIIKLWTREWTKVKPEYLADLIRFNESIDQALMESTVRFKERVEHSKDMFIGILSHDLRNPLGAILMSSQLLLEGRLDKEQIYLSSSQIKTSAERMNKMITDLLDLTRINLGTGIPVTKSLMDISVTIRQVVEEIQAAHPNRVIFFEATGNAQGVWDSSRIAQVFSNLIGNAIRYGFDESPITINVTETSNEFIISVHNEGILIPKDKLVTIFDNLTQVVKEGEEQKESTGLGLGLYIAKEIVIAHSGKINATSSKKYGTTFTVQLPRDAHQSQDFQVAA